MKTICLYFEIHQITHLKRYRFFEIGTDHYYYDDYENEKNISYIAENSYIPTLSTLLDMCKENKGAFKVAFSLSGVGIEQLEMHAPKVLDLLQQLNETGCVEFLAEPYSHGLASLINEDCFAEDVKMQQQKIEEYFGKKPTVLRNSSLIYSDQIGEQAAKMGFKGMLTEGAKQVLGWKSPHYVYNCAWAPKLKLLMRDITLSDDISLRFNDSSWNEYPLFADNYINKIARLPEEEQVVNIFMELSSIGCSQPLSSNILEFLKALPICAKNAGVSFSTPSEICAKVKSVGAIDVPEAVSWNDEERDCSSLLGNALQQEAFKKLYSISDRVRIASDPRLIQDWAYLQASNNFAFMTTKWNGIAINRSIYSDEFDAFTNYMNILADFISRVNSLYPDDLDNEQLNSLLTTIRNQGDELEMTKKEVERLKAKLARSEANAKPKAEKAKAEKPKTACKTMKAEK